MERHNPFYHLTHLRDDFSEEIPERIIHSTAPDNKYKVRRQWFQGVTATIETVIEAIEDVEAKQALKDFVDKYTSDEFKAKPRTELSDINAANEAINIALRVQHPRGR